MNFISSFIFLLVAISYISADLLDGLDHSHDDHSIDHDDLEDQFEEFSSLREDAHDSEVLPEFEEELLREIEQFLPDKEHQSLAFVQGGESFNQLGGVPLTPQINLVESNQLPQSQGIPLIPEVTGDRLQLEPVPAFDIAVEKPIPASNPVAVNQPGPVINIQPIIVDDFDSIENFEPLDVDIQDALSPASFSHDSAFDDYDEINSNLIGGQGRQLSAFNSAEAPRAPSSFNLLDGDFPNYDLVPDTSFTCSDKQYYGYYADTEAGCQAFHICLDSAPVASFLCPNGTLFNQNYFVCDWWFNVDCSLAPQSYQLNARLGVVPGSDEEEFGDYS